MQSVSMDQSAALRVKNRRILPDVVDYQLQLNAKNSQIMRVQQNQGNGKTYISVFNTAPANETTTDKKCKNHNNLDILTHNVSSYLILSGFDIYSSNFCQLLISI